MPDRIVSFTDSDWAGCSKTAKSTSGGAICLGEHVIKTYCKQQKVIALSSAEAELYAMVAASAETLAIAAYARDLGLEMQCELYCDSAAALGIIQRAGIGKVRHLRTQGLWVQEVRISGRISYKKVLGEKNPADLLTKHMTSELANRHLETLNMKADDGRAASAPSLNSVESKVTGWYEHDEFQEEYVNIAGMKFVRFDDKVQVRPIPAEGRGRRVPKNRRRADERLGRNESDERGHQARDAKGESQIMTAARECSCEHPRLARRGDGRRWADVDEDEYCEECKRSWTKGTWHPETTTNRDNIDDRERLTTASNEHIDERPLYTIDRVFVPCGESERQRRRNSSDACIQDHDLPCNHEVHDHFSETRSRFCFDSVANSDMFCVLPVGGDGKRFSLGHMFAKHRMAYRHRDASCRKGDSPQTSLSAGHLEAGQSVRNLRWRLNSSASVDMFCSSQSQKDADSTIGSRRRRSVGDGSHWQWVHMHASTYAWRDMCERRDAHVQVLLLQACVGQHDMRVSAFMFGSSAI